MSAAAFDALSLKVGRDFLEVVSPDDAYRCYIAARSTREAQLYVNRIMYQIDAAAHGRSLPASVYGPCTTPMFTVGKSDPKGVALLKAGLKKGLILLARRTLTAVPAPGVDSLVGNVVGRVGAELTGNEEPGDEMFPHYKSIAPAEAEKEARDTTIADVALIAQFSDAGAAAEYQKLRYSAPLQATALLANATQKMVEALEARGEPTPYTKFVASAGYYDLKNFFEANRGAEADRGAEMPGALEWANMSEQEQTGWVNRRAKAVMGLAAAAGDGKISEDAFRGRTFWVRPRMSKSDEAEYVREKLGVEAYNRYKDSEAHPNGNIAPGFSTQELFFAATLADQIRSDGTEMALFTNSVEGGKAAGTGKVP